MKKLFHIAKADILRHKGTFVSLFIIIIVVMALITIGLSILLGGEKDFEEVMDRTNSYHSLFLMTRDMYNPSFEDILKGDARVSQYEITQALSPSSITVNYGGEVETAAYILNLDDCAKISAPVITEEDLSIPRERAIYIPAYARSLGYNTGDEFIIVYRNKVIPLTVAGFFTTNDFQTVNTGGLKFFAPDECYESLNRHIDASVWITVRLHNAYDSLQFNRDFAAEINYDITDFIMIIDYAWMASSVIDMVAIFFAIVFIFALLIAFVSLFVIRFRVMSSVEDTMHEIGVLKASGYTSAELIACYILEYGLVSLPAALLGVAASIPAFPTVRQAMSMVSGVSWSLGTDVAAGVIAALFVVAILLTMVMRSCRKIKKLPPVIALHGSIAISSHRRNFFPLRKGTGSVNMRMGLKNVFVYIKSYAMVGIIIAVMSIAAVVVTVLYYNLAIDQIAFARMAGIETCDVVLETTRHADADALATMLEKMPEVRKTSMLDAFWMFRQVDDFEALFQYSNDYSQLEDMFTHDGRFPIYDNEIAIPKIFADQLDKEIGDSVMIKASGISQEYIITGFFSTVNNSGRVAAVTLEGYRRLDPNTVRRTINVYLNEGVTVGEFTQKLQQKVGVVNVFRSNEGSAFSDSKAVAEEKISNYIDHYNVDSVEYAVIYNGDIILSGSSSEYQIECVADFREAAKATLGNQVQVIALIVQVVMILSLLIISLIISMTTRNIVTKRYRELGTLKALGFTTKQLKRQLSISFMPGTAIGAVIGCASGAIIAGPFLTLLFASTGIYGAAFAVTPLIVFIVGALFILASYIVANICAGRIRSISAYDLISEGPVAKKARRQFAPKKPAVSLVAFLVCIMTVLSPVSAIAESVQTRSTDVSAQSQKLYGIGSVSKVFTASAVMKLVEEGKVDLDEPVITYIPDFSMADERYAQITPRMLLNHSCGFMGSTFDNTFLLGDADTLTHDSFLELLKSQPLKHDPGDRSIYCNDGFTLAEILVERVSGVSFTEYLEHSFSAPLGLENIKTPQSDFDYSWLAAIYMGNSELKPETLGVIGSGGIYSTMEDLCRFAAIFMDDADGTVLSKDSVDEMAKNQHMNDMISPDADTIVRYGLGWDSIETYPFTQLGIKALSKGGDTNRYHTNLTVLPEYNLAVAVSSSGTDSHAQIISQEILLAVLKEEGLIDGAAGAVMPVQNLERAEIPDSYSAYAGIYDAGVGGQWSIDFTEGSLIVTPIMVRNERSLEFIYNTAGEFISINNDYMGGSSSKEGARGVTVLSFVDGKYMMRQTYENLPGLGVTAIAVPFAERLEGNDVPSAALGAWRTRNSKEYLLVSEKYSSVFYIMAPIAKTLTDDRVPGYVTMGIYQGSGAPFSMARINDVTTAQGFQTLSTMAGRDTTNLYISNQNGVEYFSIKTIHYIDSATIQKLSDITGTITIGSETIWVDIDGDVGGRIVNIETPTTGAWFVYDGKMNCMATSQEAQPRSTINLPENGRLAFAGEPGTEFVIR